MNLLHSTSSASRRGFPRTPGAAASALFFSAIVLAACFSCSQQTRRSESSQPEPQPFPEAYAEETVEAGGATAADIKAMKSYAQAFQKGDLTILEQYKRFETSLERDLFRRIVQQLMDDPRQAPQKVQLVYVKPLSGDRLFACFLSTAGDPPEITPLTHIFHKENGAWKTVPDINPRTFFNARTRGLEQFQRLLVIDQYIKLSFLPDGITHLADHMKAQVEAFRTLSEPPYNLPFQKHLIDQTEKQYESLEKLRGRPKEELQEFILKEQKQTFSPKDFEFALYLEADKEQNNLTREIPYEDGERTFTAEALPCLTESFVLGSAVEEQSGGETYQVSFTLTSNGAKVFSSITSNNIGKKLGIAFKGRIQAAPVIHTEISGGKGLISGNFTRERAEEIARVLNSYKEQLEELLKSEPEEQE